MCGRPIWKAGGTDSWRMANSESKDHVDYRASQSPTRYSPVPRPAHAATLALRGKFLRRLPARHAGAGRRDSLAFRPRHRADLAAVVERRRLYAGAGRGHTVLPFRAVRRNPAVPAFLCGRYRLRAFVRHSGLSGHAGAPDGAAIRRPGAPAVTARHRDAPRGHARSRMTFAANFDSIRSNCGGPASRLAAA